MYTDPQSWDQRHVYIDKQSWDQRHMYIQTVIGSRFRLRKSKSPQSWDRIGLCIHQMGRKQAHSGRFVCVTVCSKDTEPAGSDRE